METALLGSETAAKVITKDSACPSLTVKQRVYGFVACFVLGLFLSFLSIGGLVGAFLNTRKFALLYSIGNLCSIGSTLFLIGPMRQLKRMFHPKRVVSTILFLGSLIATVVFSFFFDKSIGWHKLVLLLLMLAQFCSLFWYTLSYIPFGQKICKKICCAVCCEEDGDSQSTSGGDAKA